MLLGLARLDPEEYVKQKKEKSRARSGHASAKAMGGFWRTLESAGSHDADALDDALRAGAEKRNSKFAPPDASLGRAAGPPADVDAGRPGTLTRPVRRAPVGETKAATRPVRRRSRGIRRGQGPGADFFADLERARVTLGNRSKDVAAPETKRLRRRAYAAAAAAAAAASAAEVDMVPMSPVAQRRKQEILDRERRHAAERARSQGVGASTRDG
jgi:hypothetical protein